MDINNAIQDAFEKAPLQPLPAMPEQPKDPFQPISHTDLMQMAFQPLQWLAESFIPAEAITIISGNPEAYKSWIVTDAVIKSVSNDLLFGKFQAKSKGCLIIDEENGLRLIQERVKLLTTRTDLPIYYLAYSNTKITEESITKIIAFCKEKGIDTVVFDSFVRFLNGADENSSTDISRLFGMLKRLVQAKLAVILIHHHRKEGAVKSTNGQDMRGSSDILASVNCHIIVEKKDENQILITPNKLREALKMKPFLLKVEKNEGATSFIYNQEFYDENEINEGLQKLIFNLLASKGEMIMDTICASLSGVAGIMKVKANVRYMENIGTLDSERRGQGGKKTFFVPIEKDRSLPF